MLLGDVPPTWLPVTLRWIEGETDEAADPWFDLDVDHAAVVFESRDTLHVDREPLVATITTPSRSRDNLAHPQLAWLSAIVARWDHRPVIHGGVVMVDGRAWALVADKGGGKSTSLAHLHASGFTVLADDQVVLIGDRVAAGPRTLDLRPTAPLSLRAGARYTMRVEVRWRLTLPPCDPEVPFAGLLLLVASDDERDELRSVRPAERLPRLAPHLVLPDERAAPDLLPLASFPTYEWRRPLVPALLPRLAEVLREISR